MKDELGGKTMKEFAALRPTMYIINLRDEGLVDKKVKSTKKFVIKREKKFKDYKECLYKECKPRKSVQRRTDETSKNKKTECND